MGSKLALLAALIASAGAVREAAADDAAKARELFDKGVAEYKAEHYEKAAALLAASYAYVAKPDALFAQAQAERLAGHCDRAIEHYQQLLDESRDAKIKQAVETNLALCPKPKVETGAPAPAVVEAPAAPPQIVTKTVVRETHHTDKLAAFSAAAGGISLGVSIGFLLAAKGTSDDATHARTLDEANDLEDHASSQRLIGYITGGAGVALIGFATYRWLSGGHSTSSKEVAIVPTTGGTFVSLSSRW